MLDGNTKTSPLAIENMEGVFRAYYPRLCYFAFTMLESKEMAEDMVQDVFLRLQGRMNDFFAETPLIDVSSIVKDRFEKRIKSYLPQIDKKEEDGDAKYEMYEECLSYIESEDVLYNASFYIKDTSMVCCVSSSTLLTFVRTFTLVVSYFF